MSITTYAELQTAVENWLARSDLTSRVTEFIQLGESRLNSKLRLFQQETTDTSISLASSSDSASLPSGFLEAIDLYYNTDYYRPTQVDKRTLNALRSTSTARPNYYTVDTAFQFEISADQAYTLTCDYYAKWDIATDSTNWLLTNAPDAYLRASLTAAFEYIRNTEEMLKWKQLTDESIKELNRVDSRTRGQATMRVDAGLRSRDGRSFNINRGY